MPATRSRSRSPRRSSTSSYSKDKPSKPNSRELITIKTENKDGGGQDNKDSPSSKTTSKTTMSDKSKSTTNATSAKDNKPAEKTYRKPSESPASKGGNSGNWNSAIKTKERKFSGRCRLFVGNLLSCDETELKEMFEKYGEVAEVFVNKDKGFGFVRLVSSSCNNLDYLC